MTPEDEIAVLLEELMRTRRRLVEKELAPFDWRVCDWERWRDSLQATRNRVEKLERDLDEAFAARQAADAYMEGE